MGDGRAEQSARTVGEIAADLLDIWWQDIAPDGKLALNLGMLCYVRTIGDFVRTENNVELPAIGLVRYVLAALPRSYIILDAAKRERSDKCKGELRAMVGGIL